MKVYHSFVQLWCRCPFAVPEKNFGLTRILDFFDRCTPSCPAAPAPGSAGQLGPDSHLRFESDRHSKKADTPMGICFFGAGDRTRTGTLSPAVDFESTTSTIPSHRRVYADEAICYWGIIHQALGNSKQNFSGDALHFH